MKELYISERWYVSKWVGGLVSRWLSNWNVRSMVGTGPAKIANSRGDRGKTGK